MVFRIIITLIILTWPVGTPAQNISVYRAVIIASSYTIKEEGFRRCAYWDYSRYSIGYGTKAKSQFECLAREDVQARKIAKARMLKHLTADALFIYKIKPEINTEQLAILTAAAYNSGRNGIMKAVDSIPDHNKVALELRKNHKNLSGVRKRVNLLADKYLEVS